MKKIICCFMSVMMLFGIAVIPASALSAEEVTRTADAENLIVSSLGKDSLDTALVQTVKKDMALMEEAYLGRNGFIDGMQVNDDGSVVYTYSVRDDLVGYFTVSKSAAGDLTVSSREGDLYNELTLTADGRTLLNGKNLYAEEPAVQEVSTQDQSIMRAGPISRYYKYTFTKSGWDVVTPSGFNRGSTSTGTYVSMSDFLKNMTSITLRDIFRSKYLRAMKNIITGIPDDVMSTVIDAACTTAELDRIRAENPNSKSINYKITIFSKNGNNTLYSEWLYAVKLYGNKECSGKPAISGAKKITEST